MGDDAGSTATVSIGQFYFKKKSDVKAVRYKWFAKNSNTKYIAKIFLHATAVQMRLEVIGISQIRPWPKFRSNVSHSYIWTQPASPGAAERCGLRNDFLTLIFSCGDGCGFPASVTLPTPYETQQQCMDAGKVWISPAANFTFAIRGYQCDPIGGTDESP
jgi:hypothetical protein